MKKSEKFNLLLDKLKYYNETSPEVTIKKVESVVDELEAYENLNHFSLKNIDKRKLGLGIMIFIIFISGLFNISEETTVMYYAGLIFFLVGMGVGLFAPGFCLIFFFSHGISGLGLMLFPIIDMVENNPVLTDGSPSVIYMYIAIIVLLVIAAIVMTIIYNISKNLKKIPNAIFIPTGLFTLAIFLTTISTYVLPILNKLIN